MNIWKTVLRAALLLCPAVGAQTLLINESPLPRPVLLRVAEATQPVRLARVTVDVLVAGRLAKTTVEMTFRNPNARQLEGELQFPLLDGQEISGFALDFDGKWRPAVAVDKGRGQEIFEDITRARVDPALLETTQGNNYKLRVYPIPANGERKVSLTISERLQEKPNGTKLLRLPLAFGERVDTFDLRIQAAGLPPDAVKVLRGVPGARWQDRPGGATLEVHHENHRLESLTEISFSPRGGPLLTVEEFDGKRYFYAELPAPAMVAITRPKPARLALVWDASGSGASRDHGRELALLDAYFKALGNTAVQLTLARDSAEDGGSFVVSDGNWSALRTALENTRYDGGTNLAAFQPATPSDAVLLFSDGLGNFASATMPEFTAPLLAVSAAVSADHARLRHAAERSGGVFVDLIRTTPAAAATALRMIGGRLATLRSNSADELVATPVDSSNGRLAIAGVLKENSAPLDLEWRQPDGRFQGQHITVSDRHALPGRFAAQAWARLRLEQLLPEKAINRAEISRLGKTFGLVTPGTSLIVLDRVEDYVRYQIRPPAELYPAYERLVATQERQVERDRASHLEEVVRRFKEKQAWWEREFPKGNRPRSKPESGAVGGLMAVENSRPAIPPIAPGAMRTAPAMAAPSPAHMAKAIADKANNSPNPIPVAARIQLKKWLPDAPYIERLRQADNERIYRVYLDERPSYLNSTAFFLDAADIFFERGQPQLATRILSNLAEMDLENRHVLRILAYRLLQAHRADLAVPVLERVLELAPDEPQSWRDLGLAQAENGKRQQAVASLYQVAIRPWHNRFPDIELVALAEMNALLATAPTPIDTSTMTPPIDTRLLRNLPLDLRVVLSWDADNTDIDLWVTDPNGEKAYFANRLSYQGGAVSRDFTGGYGPEEFSLKKAKPGKYLVQAQFYGHRQQVVAGATTLNLRLYTAFGSAEQKEERITLRLKGQGEVVTIGEFLVGD